MSIEKIVARQHNSKTPWKKIFGFGLPIGLIVFVIISIITGRIAHQNAEIAFAKAKDQIKLGDAPAALQALDEAIHFEENADYYYYKYLIHSHTEHPYEAEIDLKKAIERDPNNASYQYEEGLLANSNEEDAVKALPYFKKASELDPKNSDYRLYYASMLAETGKREDAIQILEKLSQEDPHYEAVWQELAAQYHEVNQPEQVLHVHQQAVKLFPEDSAHWYWLAIAYDKNGNQKEAVEAYQKVIELDPEAGTESAYRIAKLTGKPVAEKYREIVEDAVPVEFENGQALLYAKFEGSPGQFLLDTGATDSILYERFLKANQLEIPSDAPKARYQTANGIVSAPVSYGNLKLGRFELSNVRIAILKDPTIDKKTDGIIGMNVLRNFNLKIDNPHSRVILSRK